MGNVRKRHTAEFKVKVALEAIRQRKTTNELTTEYGVHATQVSTWKKQALASMPPAFSRKNGGSRGASRQRLTNCTAGLGNWLPNVTG